MRLPRSCACAATVILACLTAGCGSSGPSTTSLAERPSPQCSLGTQLGEGRQLLAPRPGTFYSVDVLNPDVVFFDGRYLMYFSGNDRHTQEGNWREGFAIATSPTGPFVSSKTWKATISTVAPRCGGALGMWLEQSHRRLRYQERNRQFQ